MSHKIELRRRFRAKRQAYSADQVQTGSQRIEHHLLALPELTDAHRVFIYASAGGEVQTLGLIENLLSLGKTVALPRITDPAAGVIRAVVIRSLDDLVPGDFGILAPRGAPHGSDLLLEPAEVCIVPGLAFSPRSGTRLGMGGGYYDRYFATHPQPAFIVGLAFEYQLEDDLPVEPHDVAVHAIATPHRVIRTKPLRR